jgi:hypothetical protein
MKTLSRLEVVVTEIVEDIRGVVSDAVIAVMVIVIVMIVVPDVATENLAIVTEIVAMTEDIVTDN